MVAVRQGKDGSVELSSDDIPSGWTCELATRGAEDRPELGQGLFVRVLDVNPDKGAMRVTGNEFGFEHLNDKRRERYLGALDLVVGLLEQESMPADAAVVHAVSEVKGMFTQCRMKNQRAWYRVWQALGEPSRDEAARWSRNLDELRKSLGDDAAFATLASDLLQEDLPETLRRAARSIRDEGRAIAAGRTIDDRASMAGKAREAGERHRRALPAETQRKLRTANARHEAVIQHLREALEVRGLTVTENRFVDAQCVLPEGGSLLFEVKSLAADNELSQMRSGIAQLYEYRYREDLENASLWLVFSRKPQQEPWIEHYLEEDRDIRVLWLDSGELRGPSLNVLPRRSTE